MRLKDKVIIVTGSTTGIGEAMARRFVAEGARVLVHGLERDLGEKVVADLGKSAALHIDDLADSESPGPSRVCRSTTTAASSRPTSSVSSERSTQRSTSSRRPAAASS